MPAIAADVHGTSIRVKASTLHCLDQSHHLSVKVWRPLVPSCLEGMSLNGVVSHTDHLVPLSNNTPDLMLRARAESADLLGMTKKLVVPISHLHLWVVSKKRVEVGVGLIHLCFSSISLTRLLK